MRAALLCATVTGQTTEELRAQRDRVVGADLVELRLDYVDRPDVVGALADRRSPVIVTCRPTWEGGRFDGPEEDRRLLLSQALESGAEYVDIEWRAGFDDLIRRRHGRNVVVSTHDFTGLPDDLNDRYRAMRATGAEVVKVAAAVESLGEVLTLAAIGCQERPDEKCVVIGMGMTGLPSRVLAGRFGSSWTYAGDAVAPGQLSVDVLRDQFRFHEITESTAVYGVLGKPIGHSLSPGIHNAGFGAAGIDAVYLPLEARDMDDFARFADAVGMRGVSVTAPFKEEMMARVDRMDAIARRVGAVNTVRFDSDGWCGINTDVPAFLEPLDGRMALGGTRATVLGSGGAARAVALALVEKGVAVTVCARNVERAAAVARTFGAVSESMPPTPGSWDLLVNTTPVGTFPDVDVTPIPGATFDGNLVYDLVYNPRTTLLMAEATASGCDTIGGLDMLVAQAERQFEWWTGRLPPVGLYGKVAARGLSTSG